MSTETGAERLQRAMKNAEQVMTRVTPQQLGDALQIDLAKPLTGETATVPIVLRALIDVTRALTQLSHEQHAGVGR